MANNVRTERAKKTEDRMGEPLDFKMRVGEIMENSDPTYMGRLWVYIDEKGRDKKNEDNWKIVSYCSPFYGATNIEHNSTNDEFHETQQSYGMWMTPPDIGTLVLCCFADGSPDKGYVIGGIPEAYMNHMIPAIGYSHFWDPGTVNKSFLNKFKGKPLPVAEYNKKRGNVHSIKKRTFKPVHMPQFRMFLEQGLINDESRGITSSSAQRETPSSVFGISTPGRPLDQKGLVDPIKENMEKIKKTPDKIGNDKLKIWNRQGGHSFVMDDGDYEGFNQLVRIRTASGHQIVMHDTDDFIYIANAKGTAWVEIAGTNIDVFSTGSINMHTNKDFNFHADGDINMEAGGSINMKSIAQHVDTNTITTKTNNYDLKVEFDYNRTVVGTSILKYTGDRKIHIGKDTYNTNDVGVDYSSVGCPIRTSQPTGCTVPTDAIGGIPTLTAESIKDNADASTGLKWAPDGTLTTITKRVPQHEPWGGKDAL